MADRAQDTCDSEELEGRSIGSGSDSKARACVEQGKEVLAQARGKFLAIAFSFLCSSMCVFVESVCGIWSVFVESGHPTRMTRMNTGIVIGNIM